MPSPAPHARPHAAGQCAVSIRATNALGASSTIGINPMVGSVRARWLSLAEVQLYGSLGNLLPRTSLNFSMSTTGLFNMVGPVAHQASYCNDGATTTVLTNANGSQNSGPGQVCNTDYRDPYPVLVIAHPCQAGGLSRVLITNRAENPASPAPWIGEFTVDVIVNGVVTTTNSPAPSLPSYSIPVGE